MFARIVRMNLRSNSALMRTGALASLKGTEVKLCVSPQVLKPVVSRGQRKITIEMIQGAVSEAFGLRPGQLKEKTSTKAISYPRQIAMYLARELTGASLPKIGRAFGGKQHATVLHAVRKTENSRRTNRYVDGLIHTLIDTVRSRQIDSVDEKA